MAHQSVVIGVVRQFHPGAHGDSRCPFRGIDSGDPVLAAYVHVIGDSAIDLARICVGVRQRAVAVARRGVLVEICRGRVPVAQVPDPFVISVPHSGGVLLGGEGGIAIGHVDNRVCCGGEVRLHPGGDAPGAVYFKVVVELGAGAVVKGDVVAVGLGIGGKVSVGQGDEGGGIGKVGGDLGGVDRDGLAVRVFVVPQGRRGNSVGRRKRGWRKINAVSGGGGDGLGSGAAVT